MSGLQKLEWTAESSRRRGRSDDGSARSDAPSGPYELFSDISRANLEAMLKATDIFARGLKMLNTAMIGSSWMAVDDAIADARVAMSCRGPRELFLLEASSMPMNIRRYLNRAFVLRRMTTQLVQDALFPLERRLVLAFDLFGRNGR
jgi:Phasin protein.